MILLLVGLKRLTLVNIADIGKNKFACQYLLSDVNNVFQNFIGKPII
jgi:hypothetical protein